MLWASVSHLIIEFATNPSLVDLHVAKQTPLPIPAAFTSNLSPSQVPLAFWSALFGGLLSAAVAWLTQWLAGKNLITAQKIAADTQVRVAEQNAAATRTLEESRNKRTDEGTLRQVRALLADLSMYVDAGRRNGLVDPKKWQVVMDRLLDRIYRSDVGIALSDEQARMVYRATHSALLSLQAQWTIQKEWDDYGEVLAAKGQPLDQAKREFHLMRTKVNCDIPFRELKAAWLALGDKAEAARFMTDEEFSKMVGDAETENVPSGS